MHTLLGFKFYITNLSSTKQVTTISIMWTSLRGLLLLCNRVPNKNHPNLLIPKPAFLGPRLKSQHRRGGGTCSKTPNTKSKSTRKRRPRIIDGGLATWLETGHQRDLSVYASLWSTGLLRDDPEVIEDAHFDFLSVTSTRGAGGVATVGGACDVIITCTYQTHLGGFRDAAQFEESIRQAVEVAERARERGRRERREFFRAGPEEKDIRGKDIRNIDKWKKDSHIQEEFQSENLAKPTELKSATDIIIHEKDILIAGSCGSYGASLANGAEYHGDFGFPEGASVAERERILREFHLPRMKVLTGGSLVSTAGPKSDSETVQFTVKSTSSTVTEDSVPDLDSIKSTRDLDFGIKSSASTRPPPPAPPLVDFLAAETVPLALEGRVLSKLFRELRMPGTVTFACRNGRELGSGEPIRDAVRELVLERNSYLIGVGVNCTPPQHVEELIGEIKEGLREAQNVLREELAGEIREWLRDSNIAELIGGIGEGLREAESSNILGPAQGQTQLGSLGEAGAGTGTGTGTESESESNCDSESDSHSDSMADLHLNLKDIRFIDNLVKNIDIVVYPNSGELYCGRTKTWTADPAVGGRGFAEMADTWRKAGATWIGGCCRTTPGDIRAVRESFLNSGGVSPQTPRNSGSGGD